MATIATIRADLIGSSAVFRSEMIAGARQANQSLVQVRSDVRQTAESIVAMNRAAAGFIGFQAVKRGVGDLVDAQLKMQSIHYTLLAATGSAQLAGQAFEFVQERAHTLGLDLQPAAEGFARLSASASALGVSMADQMALFDAYAKASTTLHLSSDKSNSALMALEQMMGKGKIQAQELRLQLGQAIPGAAARFQNAVMEMVKGTDLAGKSFDQLLQAGELTTTRFLPALVQALQASGRGWEEASHGLNAELNRLRTNWLQMKADVSGGLFDDAATASVRLMADNLQNLADVAGVTGGLVVSRLAGIGLSGAYSGAERYLQETRGAQMAAAAEVKHAEAMLAEAEAGLAVEKSLQAEIEQTQRSIAAGRQATAQALEQAAAEHALALAARDSAEAFAQKHGGNASPMVQEAILDKQTAAQNRLNAATARYNEIRGAQSLLRDQVSAQGRLLETAKQSVRMTGEEVEALNAKLVAARNVEVELNSFAATAGRAAKSFGNFALGLVGGPWGAAIAAIGALGYSMYSAAKRTEEANQAFKDQIKNLQELRPHIVDVSAAYKAIASSMTTSSFLQEWKTAGGLISETEAKIAAIKAELAQIAQNHASPGYYLGQGAGFDNDEKRIAGLRATLDQLQASSAPSKAQFLAMSATLREQLGPAFDDIKAKAEKVNDQDFSKFIASLDDATRKAISNSDQLRKAFSQGFGSLQTMAESYQKQAEDYHKNNAQKAYNEVRRRALAIYQASAPDAAKKVAVDALVKEGAAAIRAAHAYDELTKSRRPEESAAKAQQQAYESLTNSQNGQLASLQQQLDTTKKVSTAQQALNEMLAGGNAAFRKLSATQQADAVERQRHIVSLTDQAKALQQATKDAEAYAVVQDNLARIAQQSAREHQDALAGIGQGSKATADQQGLTALWRQYEDLMSQAGRQLIKGPDHGGISQAEYDQEVAAYKASLDQMLRDTRDFYDQRDAMQADWKNGAIKAMEDWHDAAANNAELAADVVTGAATSMTNAFVEFAATGKLSFKDFADSLIRDLARIAYQKAIAGLFDYALSAYFGYGSGTPATGGSTTPAGNGFTYNLPFGGGKATGGATAGGTLYEVAEGGRPELYQSGGRTYLLSSRDGHVTPASSGSVDGGGISAGGGVKVVIENHTDVQPKVSQSTGSNGESIITVLMKKVDDRMTQNAANPSSTFGKALAGTYGLQRRGVPVGG